MTPSLNIIGKTIIANNKFANFTRDQLIQKQKDYHSNKFIRYFKAHKGRTFILFILLIILLVCFYYQIPINGDLDTTNTLTQFASAGSYISANVFTTLLIAIIGVETYMSREELTELKEMADVQMISLIEEKKSFITKIKLFIEKYYNKLKINKKLLEKYRIIKNKNSTKPTNNIISVKPSQIAIDRNSQIDNDDNPQIYNDNNQQISISGNLETEIIINGGNDSIIIKNDDLIKILEDQLLLIDDPKLKFKLFEELNNALM